MNSKKLAIIVGEFPILSQSFVLRMIESIYQDGLFIDIYATDRANLLHLEVLSPYIFRLVKEKKIYLYAPHNSSGDRLNTIRKIKHLTLNLMRYPLFSLSLVSKGIRLSTLRHALTIRRLLKIDYYDIIHAQFLNLALAVVAGTIDRNDSARLISYVRGFDIGRDSSISNSEYALLLASNRLSSITSVSQSLADIAVRRGFLRDIVKVIHSGIPVDRFNFELPSKRNNKILRFIQVGRLIDKKGFDQSLKMLSTIGIDNFYFDVVGGGPNLNKLKSIAADLGIGNKVSFYGPLDHSDVSKIIARSDIMLCPSVRDKNGDIEGIPNVLKEAMALGVICVASDHSGITELIVNKETGFIFKESDVDNFTIAVKLAINSKECWDLIAKNARLVIEQNFNDKIISKELIMHYNFNELPGELQVI
jgi:colanic acid/amylovoran biosynthesis glycosyltransferase